MRRWLLIQENKETSFRNVEEAEQALGDDSGEIVEVIDRAEILRILENAVISALAREAISKALAAGILDGLKD